jgi:hypothetical protein
MRDIILFCGAVIAIVLVGIVALKAYDAVQCYTTVRCGPVNTVPSW